VNAVARFELRVKDEILRLRLRMTIHLSVNRQMIWFASRLAEPVLSQTKGSLEEYLFAVNCERSTVNDSLVTKNLRV
jgi:hypothetical protein